MIHISPLVSCFTKIMIEHGQGGGDRKYFLFTGGKNSSNRTRLRKNSHLPRLVGDGEGEKGERKKAEVHDNNNVL